LLVSAKVAKGKIIELKLHNTSVSNIERMIDINPRYKGPDRKKIVIPAGKAVIVN